MPPIHIMIKPVSGACNLHCRYCFYADEVSHRATPSYGVMQPDTMQTLIRKAFLYAEDAISFSFQGGEPTLASIGFYRSFIKTVGEYNTRGLQISYSLQTNATLLTDELCALFAEHHFLIGVSMDGTEATHNALRTDTDGNGTHAAVLHGIALLKKHKVDFNILCVVTKEVADNVRAVWKALAPFGHIQFIPCIDALDGTEMSFSLDAKRYGEFLVEVFDLYRSSFFSASPVRERRMDNYLSMFLGYPPEHCGMSGECGVYFLSEADGSIFPCDFYALDAWKLGNIRETSFARMVKGETMQRFRVEGGQLPEICRTCKYVAICRGGCRRDREPTLQANRFCESYKYFFDRRLDDLRALAAAVRSNML